MSPTNKKPILDLSVRENQILVLKSRGRIITFKHKNTQGIKHQVLVQRLVINKDGAAMLEGKFKDSPWFNSLDEMLQVIDWDFIKNAHDFSSISDS